MATDSFKQMQMGFAKAYTQFHVTETEMYINTVEDVTDIMEINKFLKTFSPQDLTNKKSGWRWVARLPLSLDQQLAKKGIYKSKAEFNRWKNDPDNDIWALSRDVKLINKGRTK
jgi:hypothetical protein